MSARGEKFTLGTLMFLAGLVGGTATTTVAATNYVARVVEERISPLEARQARLNRWLVASVAKVCTATDAGCPPPSDLIDEPGRP